MLELNIATNINQMQSSQSIVGYKQILKFKNMALASGFEPEFPASEASALSIKLRKQTQKTINSDDVKNFSVN